MLSSGGSVSASSHVPQRLFSAELSNAACCVRQVWLRTEYALAPQLPTHSSSHPPDAQSCEGREKWQS
jgi:hypothetical protein